MTGRVDFADDASATLELEAAAFHGTISGFDGNDRIVLDGLPGAANPALHVDITANGAIVSIGSGAQLTTLTLSGHYEAAGFAIAIDDHHNAVLTYTELHRTCATVTLVDSILG